MAPDPSLLVFVAATGLGKMYCGLGQRVQILAYRVDQLDRRCSRAWAPGRALVLP